MSLLRKGMLVSGGQVLNIPLGMAAGIIFSRALGPDGMGQYELFRTTATLAATIVALGLGPANIFFLNNRQIEPERVATNTLTVGTVLGGLLAAGLSAAVLSLPGYFGAVSVWVVLGFALGAALLLNVNILRTILTAQLAARRMVAIDLVRALTLLIGGGGLALLGWLSPGAAIVVLSLSGAAAFGLLLAYLAPLIQIRRPFEWRLLRQVVSYGLQLAALNLLQVLSASITVLLLRYLRQEQFAEIGLYTRAVAVCSLVSVVPVAIGPLLYAKWSGVRGTERTRQAEMAARLNLSYGIVMCALVALLGKYILWLMYGNEFIPATAALLPLAPALLFIPLFEVCNNLLAGDGRAATTVCVLAGTLVVVAVVTVLTVPTLGIRGAALAVLAGNAFTALTSLAICRKLYGLRVGHCLAVRPSDLRAVREALVRRT
jgi:O-antigen/teichoic acid export membrane protein